MLILALRMVELDIPATILALAALATAMGVPAFIASRRSRRAADRSASASERAAAAAESVIESVSPHNGAGTIADELNARFDALDRRHTELVAIARMTARTIEVVEGRLHDVSKRIDAQDRELRDIKDTVHHTDRQVP